MRERLTAGDSDKQVMDFLVARYGQFVLLRPRFEWQTALLWLTPLVVLMLGAFGIVNFVRRRNAAQAKDATTLSLTPEEEAKLSRLSQETNESNPSALGSTLQIQVKILKIHKETRYPTLPMFNPSAIVL